MSALDRLIDKIEKQPDYPFGSASPESLINVFHLASKWGTDRSGRFDLEPGSMWTSLLGYLDDGLGSKETESIRGLCIWLAYESSFEAGDKPITNDEAVDILSRGLGNPNHLLRQCLRGMRKIRAGDTIRWEDAPEFSLVMMEMILTDGLAYSIFERQGDIGKAWGSIIKIEGQETQHQVRLNESREWKFVNHNRLPPIKVLSVNVGPLAGYEVLEVLKGHNLY